MRKRSRYIRKKLSASDEIHHSTTGPVTCDDEPQEQVSIFGFRPRSIGFYQLIEVTEHLAREGLQSLLSSNLFSYELILIYHLSPYFKK